MEPIKLFSSSAQLNMKFQPLINFEIVKISGGFRCKTQKLVIYPAHKCKIVGILPFISRRNFSLSSVEHENSFITSGLGVKCFKSVFVIQLYTFSPFSGCVCVCTCSLKFPNLLGLNLVCVCVYMFSEISQHH